MSKVPLKKLNIKKRDAKRILDKSGLFFLVEEIRSTRKALLIKLNELNLLVINNIPLMLFRPDFSLFYPYIESVGYFKCPLIIVDRGAVPHILQGADVMVPGILSCEMFSSGDIVYIKGENTPRVIAVGKSLIDSSEIKNMKRGKAIKTLHYVGDKIWKMIQSEL